MRKVSLTGCARHAPCQKRGEERVAALLDAAVAEFAAVGYDAATMSAIAERAGASIGSLYQFFPDKQSIARAVRTAHVADVDTPMQALMPCAQKGEIQTFATGFVRLMAKFVDDHPAYLPLQDAPSSTQPIGPRHKLRTKLEEMLRAMSPRLDAAEAGRVAETILQINRAMLGLYARASQAEKGWFVTEFRGVLTEYLTRRCGSSARRKPSASSKPKPAKKQSTRARAVPRRET